MKSVSRTLALLALAASLPLVAAPARAQEMRQAAIDRCTRAAVRIQVDTPAGTSIGSGSIIDPAGYVLTNFHVVGYARHGDHGSPGTNALRRRARADRDRHFGP